jgi:hypothetical protein
VTRDPGSLISIILVVLTTVMISWRTVIKFVIIGVVALAMFGLLDLMQGLR